MIVLIPAYEPDRRLVDLVTSLMGAGVADGIVVVDDGSGPMFTDVFDDARRAQEGGRVVATVDGELEALQRDRAARIEGLQRDRLLGQRRCGRRPRDEAGDGVDRHAVRSGQQQVVDRVAVGVGRAGLVGPGFTDPRLDDRRRRGFLYAIE